MAETTYGQWALTTNKNQGSRLTNLTSGTAAGKIKFYDNVGVKSATDIASANLAKNVTGIVIPIGTAAQIGGLAGTPFSDANKANMIGDPQEPNYGLTTGDFFTQEKGGVASVERDGGAQKFINAVLDSAYVAYNSGVQLGSGLSSMTVSRGNLSLTASTVTGGVDGVNSGIVNTYSRSYSVTFNYKQSGNITAGGTSALPDITNDLVGEAGDGPF